MSITYRFSWEHPVIKAITFCLMFFSGFCIYVALMSVGRYGYIPSLQFFVPIFLLFLVNGFKAKLYPNQKGIFVEVTYCWYILKLGTRRFEETNFKKVGKFYFLNGFKLGHEYVTHIVYDKFGKSLQKTGEKT